VAEPVTLTGIEENIKINGEDTKFTIVTSYTPEENSFGGVERVNSGSFVIKNSDGDELAVYNGTTNTFDIPPGSKAPNDLIVQISNYQTGKQSQQIKKLVRRSAQQIADNSGIPIGDQRNKSFQINNNIAAELSEESIQRASGTLSAAVNSIESKNVRKGYGVYVYPEDIRTNKQDRIRFTMRMSQGSEVSPRLGGFEGSAGQNVRRRRSKSGAIAGSVTLPMQPGITDANSVDWNPGQLNAVQAFGVGASIDLMNSDNPGDFITKGGEILQSVARQLTGNNDYNNALKVYLAQQAVGVQGLLSRTTGAVLNPNMELLFNAPALRPFTFNFVLSPRSDTEAKQVKQIIRFFKQGMSVKTTNSIFLKAPNIFDIRYQTFDKGGNSIDDHPSLNRIKTCALTGFNVDYTPSGSYMTFNDNERTMTQYAIQMNFTELDPIYEDDYHDGGARLDVFSDEKDDSGEPIPVPGARKALRELEIGF